MVINWPDDSLVNEEIRTKSLEILSNNGYHALSEIEILLGWRSTGMCMPNSLIAKKLGITSYKLHNILFRKENIEKAEQKRKAIISARNISTINYISKILHFAISIPKEWVVQKDNINIPLDGNDPDLLIEKISKGMPEEIRPYPSIPIVLLRRIEVINRIKLESMVTGIFNASKEKMYEDPSVEIILLNLPRSMSAIEIYQLSKQPMHFVPTGTRPKGGITIDGLHGVKYFYSYSINDENGIQKSYRFINSYLSENLTGWIISCSCNEEQFINNRPIFGRVITSFKRDK